MMGRSHLTLTAAAYVGLSVHPLVTPLGRFQAPQLYGPWRGLGQPPSAAAIALGAAIVAITSLAADIDQPGSRASRSLGPLSQLTSRLIRIVAGHRGITHSIWPAIALAVLGGAVGSQLGVRGLGEVLAFGYAGALLLDAWTAEGIVPLYPLTWRLRLPPGFRVGSFGELSVLVVSLALCAWWAVGAPDPVRLAHAIGA
jgi:membrane-bound metal-dependent hydrolase YbcI (DUF457 family)